MPTPLEILQQYWGHPSFRQGQEAIIDSILDGNDTLALLPTGGGKSVCFQVPALVKPGICIVVSPLIALMKDQVEHLQKRGIAAAAIYSGMHYRDIDRILDNAVFGGLKFLYLSPERLTTELAQERIRKMDVNLLAVDEAHCISQWGYDFRPPYLQIAEIRAFIPDTPVLALTATATPKVREDICEKLQFRKKQIFQQSFMRSNLAYVVLHEEGKEGKLLDILKKVPGSGVVYVRNRRKTKEIAVWLRKNGIRADYYHAGLTPREREDKQDAWINDQTRIIVSTNAFGMGIDKPDVRTVVHMDLPDSLEAYFQEAGRGGRDGKKAYAVLLYNESDRISLEKQLDLAYPTLAEIRQVYAGLGSYYQLAIGSGKDESFDFDIVAFSQTFQLELNRVFNCLKVLEQEGWVVLNEAVYIPSSLRILVNKDELYDYQLRNPTFDKILKVILRTYQGAFTSDIHLREGQLANFLNITVKELAKALEIMHKDHIIQYQPQRDKPQIFFLQERVDATNLTINHKNYKLRKKQHQERIEHAIGYAEKETCRSRQLLAYFGEKDTSECGICDVCLGRSKNKINPELFKKYEAIIKQQLREGIKNLSEIVSAVPGSQEKEMLSAIAFLIDEGFIEMTGEDLRWVN